MNLRKITLSIIIGAASLGISAQTNNLDPMTEAMMKAYNQLLDEDPRDAETLFRRANEYYKQNDYIKALDDINKALKYLPENDIDTRFQALQLRANIYMMQHKYEQAVADLNAELAIDPQNYIAIYQRATALYELGRYAEAKADFHLLQQRNSRSQEALFGLARVAVKENNLGLAEELCNKAVEITPSNSQVYMRRAAVRAMAGNEQGAVDDYIIAISTDQDNTPRALRELEVLSRGNSRLRQNHQRQSRLLPGAERRTCGMLLCPRKIRHRPAQYRLRHLGYQRQRTLLHAKVTHTACARRV